MGQFFEFCGPRTNDFNREKQKGGHSFRCNVRKEQRARQVNSAEYFNDPIEVIVHPKRHIEQ